MNDNERIKELEKENERLQELVDTLKKKLAYTRVQLLEAKAKLLEIGAD